MATIEDVAKLAGVSSMTVSRVINDSDKVSTATKEKVNKAIKALDYHPNMMAKALASGSSNTFAYVTPDISDPYFGAVFKGAEEAAGDDYYLIYNSANTPSTLSRIIDTLISKGVAGVVFHDLDPKNSELKKLREADINCVLIDNEKPCRDKSISTIDIDHYDAARRVGKIFISQGYAKVACIHGSTTPVPSRMDTSDVPRRMTQRHIWVERQKGFASAFEGVKGDRLIDIEVDLSERADNYTIGQNAAEKLMKYIGRGPFAVYCAEDVLALGVKCYMQEHGVKIPEEIAIFGTDGLDMGMTLYPRLSTVVHPRMRIGQMAVEELIATSVDKHQPIHSKITLEDFFCGDTTKNFREA